MSGGDAQADKGNLDPIDRPRPGKEGEPPHAASIPPELNPDLNNPESTPGTGILPDPTEEDPNAQPSG